MYSCILAVAEALELSILAQGIEDTFHAFTPPDVKKLASIGSYSHNPQNSQRDLLTAEFMKSEQLITPDPFVIQAWVFVNSQGMAKVEKVDLSIFLPHEWVQALHNAGFADSILGTSSDCRQFWSQVHPMDPKLHKNPMLEVNGWKDKFNPMLLHADKGPHTKHDSIHTIHMYSLNALDKLLGLDFSSVLLCAIPVQCLVTEAKCKDLGIKWTKEMEETMKTVGRHLVWSFNCLFDGRAGKRDADGRVYCQPGPIADGNQRCILWQAPADCEHLSLEYGLPNYNAIEPCMRCKCNRSNIPWNDWNDDAKFKETLITPEAAMKEPLTNHWIMSIKGTSHFTFAYDLMHCGDIGFSGRSIANCFYDFIYRDPQFTGTKAQKCQQIMEMIKAKYDKLGIDDCKIQRLLLQHFLPDKGSPHKHSPDLMHSAIKAKQTNKLIPVVAAICADLPRVSIYARHRYHCMQHLSLMYQVSSRNGMFLPKVEAELFENSAKRFLKHYDALSKLSVRAGSKQWHQTPKFHFLCHIAEDAFFLNPRAIWCYPGEHMVGNATSLAQSCLAGLAAYKVPTTLCTKYKIGKHLMLREQLG